MDTNDIANLLIGVLFGISAMCAFNLLLRESPTGRKKPTYEYRVRLVPRRDEVYGYIYTKYAVDRKTWRGWVCVGEVNTLMEGREYANALANPVIEVFKGE